MIAPIIDRLVRRYNASGTDWNYAEVGLSPGTFYVHDDDGRVFAFRFDEKASVLPDPDGDPVAPEAADLFLDSLAAGGTTNIGE